MGLVGFTNSRSVGNNNWKAVAVGDFGKGRSDRAWSLGPR